MENTHIRPSREGLITEVDAFLAATGMKKTAFGKEVANDPGLVDGIRKGRDPREETASKILAFIAERKSP